MGPRTPAVREELLFQTGAPLFVVQYEEFAAEVGRNLVVSMMLVVWFCELLGLKVKIVVPVQ